MNDTCITALPDLLHFTISLAGLNIKVNTLSPGTYGYCINYISDLNPDIDVEITESDVLREIKDGRFKPDEANKQYLETIAVYRKIVENVIDYNIILMHGAVICVDNNAIMFSAPSGSGKTTHIKKWIQNAEDAYVINGDKPLIKITEREAIACGTPWCGKERMGTNTMVPLKSIVFMERSKINKIERITFAQAYPLLLQQLFYHDSSEKMHKSLNLVAKLDTMIEFYKFYFNNFKEDCFDIAYNALIKNQK